MGHFQWTCSFLKSKIRKSTPPLETYFNNASSVYLTWFKLAVLSRISIFTVASSINTSLSITIHFKASICWNSWNIYYSRNVFLANRTMSLWPKNRNCAASFQLEAGIMMFFEEGDYQYIIYTLKPSQKVSDQPCCQINCGKIVGLTIENYMA